MSDGSTEIKTMLRQSFTTIRKQAAAGLLAVEDEHDETLLGALSKMEEAMNDIRNLISARITGQE